MGTRFLLAGGLAGCLLLPAAATAGPPPLNKADAVSRALDFLSNTSVDGLAGAFRGYLAHNLPPVLYEASPNWGHTERAPEGVKWTGKDVPLHPELLYKDKNDGVWRKIRFTADNLPDTLIFDIRNLTQPEPGRMTFDVYISFDARVEYEQQNWHHGNRRYAGSARARLRVKLMLQCEATARLEKGLLLPDAVLRLYVTGAKVSYDNLVAEHVFGVGGEAAKLLGDAVEGGMHRWSPDLERELLGKAEAAIMKAGDTKEVRVTLGNLLGKKK